MHRSINLTSLIKFVNFVVAIFSVMILFKVVVAAAVVDDVFDPRHNKIRSVNLAICRKKSLYGEYALFQILVW